MRPLRAGDTAIISEVLHELYALTSFETFTEQLLFQLQKVVRADLIGVLENRPDSGPFYQFDPPGVASENTHRTWEHVGHEHAVLVHHLQTGDSGFLKISDFVPQTSYRDSALYNELYKHMDVEDALVSFFPPAQGRLAAVALHRDRRSFRERDREVLNLLQPHIVQAWRNACFCESTLVQLQTMESAAKALGVTRIVLSSDRRVRFMPPAARLILEKFFGSACGDQVPELVTRWIGDIKKNWFAGNCLLDTLQPLTVQGANSELRVHLVLGVERDTLLLQEAASGFPHSTAEELGLTTRELEVLSWVAKGRTNAEVGAILQASPRTVQKHLEHIFSKLGVETRTAAAAKLMAGRPRTTGENPLPQ